LSIKRDLAFCYFFPHDTQWVAQGYDGKKKTMPGFTKENAHWCGTFHFSKAHDARPYKKGMLPRAELSIFEKSGKNLCCASTL
jgi:hypothetical protein